MKKFIISLLLCSIFPVDLSNSAVLINKEIYDISIDLKLEKIENEIAIEEVSMEKFLVEERVIQSLKDSCYTNTWQKFIQQYYPVAKQIEKDYGISSSFILGQSALESAWGKRAPGNMLFGIKDRDGVNGNEQLIKTVEYFKSPNKKKFAKILKIEKQSNGLYKYTVLEYFRKYDDPYESFKHHAEYLCRKVDSVQQYDSYQLADQMMKIKYATAPDYSKRLKKMIDKVDLFLLEHQPQDSTKNNFIEIECSINCEKYTSI